MFYKGVVKVRAGGSGCCLGLRSKIHDIDSKN